MKKILLLCLLILAVNTAAFADVRAEFQFARQMYDDFLYEEALNKFEEIIRKYPASPEAEEARLYIGNCYMGLKQYAEAEFAYQQFINAYPNSQLIPHALYKMGESQYLSGKFEAAAKNYQRLINTYPQNPFSLASLEKVVRAYQQAGQFNDAIMAARGIIQHYPAQKQIPDIYLLLADIYLANNMPEEFETTLQKIIIDYSDADSKWLALKKLAKYYHKQGKSEQAIELIQENVSGYIPRIYEKDLLLLQADILFEMGELTKAAAKYQEYLRTFDTETNLDQVGYKIALINLQQENYKEVQQNCADFTSKFPESEYLPLVYIISAQSLTKIGNHTEALNELDNNIFQEAEDEIRFQAERLKAIIYENQQAWGKAIAQYRTIAQSYPNWSAPDTCYFRIAQICQTKQAKYTEAINYYQIILNLYPNTSLWSDIHLNLAECYEQLGEYQDALHSLKQALRQGDLEPLKQQKALDTVDYLEQYKIKNYEHALEKVMESFLLYLQTQDEDETLLTLLKIYKDDLKDYEKVISYFKQNPILENNPKFLLLKGEACQELANKLLYEEGTDVEYYYDEATQAFQKVINKFPESEECAFAEYYLIFLELRNYPKTSEEYITTLEGASRSFINKYPTFPQIGYIYLALAEAMIQTGSDTQEIITYLQQAISLSTGSEIADRAYALLGDIYLQNKSYRAALAQYEKIDEKAIFLDPNLLFNIGFVLVQLNQTEGAANYLKYFVENFPQHSRYPEAMELLATAYSQMGEFEEAIYYYQSLVKIRDNDESRRKLRDLYVKAHHYDKAMDISLQIENLTNSDKRALAEIYRENGDIGLAILQYEKVIEAEIDTAQKLSDLAVFAWLHYSLGDYKSALSAYENLLALAGNSKEMFASYPSLNWKEIGENTVVCYYKRNARKLAEDTQEMFSDFFKEEPEIQAHLLLERGIYYAEIEPKKAEKVFSEIIKDYSKTQYADDAYFQQALLSLREQDFEKAKEQLNQLIQKYPSSELINNAYMKLGSINFSQENFQDALEHYYYVIQNDQEGNLAMQATENFALTCKTLGEWDMAIEAYQLLLQRFGKEEIAAPTMFKIAFCYYMDKQYEKAIGLFDLIIPKLEDLALKTEAYFWIGDSYYEMGQYEKAIESFLNIVYNYNEFPEWDVNANIKIGMAYERLGKNDKARIFYTNIIDKYGDASKWGKEAQKRLELLP
ncbi:MAG: tetratricopeptide repeat protein [Candidatus Cloacimonadia bacterium]